MMDRSKPDALARVLTVISRLAQPFYELALGVLSNRVPWHWCFFVGSVFILMNRFQVDYLLFRKLGIEFLYPRTTALFWTYFFLSSLVGFWGWAVFQTLLRRKLIQDLTTILTESGLKTNMGRLPGYIFDRPIDESTRRLRLSKVGIPMERFKEAKSAIASGLQVYIDDMTEDLTEGTLDILYSHLPMPTQTQISEIHKIAKGSFVIGRTRTKEIRTSFARIPHLLVAGQTGGGKSTFLLQIITTLYKNSPYMKFTLIDFKRGVELGVFEKLKRVTILSQMKEVISQLSLLERELTDRMDLLKLNKVKDLEGYNRLPKAELQPLPKQSVRLHIPRHLIVIDEAAELFLASDRSEARDVQNVRRWVSQIARLGRGVGVHLVVATQRPDSKALDPQVKANLPGVLCFQMVNDASSISVLGNGRATDLAPIAGRAIWKSGLEMVEVQTPILLDLPELLKAMLDEERGQDAV